MGREKDHQPNEGNKEHVLLEAFQEGGGTKESS